MNLTKFHMFARFFLVLLTVKSVRLQESPEDNEVKSAIFEEKATLASRTRFIFYDKK